MHFVFQSTPPENYQAIFSFDWKSVQGLKVTPRGEIAILLGTVIAVLWTHNLAIGVAVGIVLSLGRLKVWGALKKPRRA